MLFKSELKTWYYQFGGDMNDIQNFAAQITENVERVIVGKRDTIELIMVALASGMGM